MYHLRNPLSEKPNKSVKKHANKCCTALVTDINLKASCRLFVADF